MKDLWLKIIAAVVVIVLTAVMVSGREVDTNHESRISVLEAKWNDIDRRLEKLDMKLDRLLQSRER